MALNFAKKSPHKKKAPPFGKKSKALKPSKMKDAPPLEEEDEEIIEDASIKKKAKPPGKDDVFKRWANGTSKDTVHADEEPPEIVEDEIEDKLINKIGEMRPADDALEGDLGLDDELAMEDDLLEASNVCWAGECGVIDMEAGDAEELLGYLEAEEPDIHRAVMDLASATSDADADEVSAAKQQLLAAEQIDPVYPEFDEAQREKAADGIVEYISEAGYPEMGTPEMVEAVAHALVEARAGEAIEDEEELDMLEEDEPLLDDDEEEVI